MLQALVVTLREGVEAALVVGITLAYIAKIGRNHLRKAVYAGLIAAAAASLGAAAIVSRLNLNQDILEGWVMLAAAVFVVSMIVFMMKTARRLKGTIEHTVDRLATRGSGAGLFAFVFLMVFREGVETVLILSAVSLNSSELMNLLGTVAGVSLAVLFGITFVKGSVRINLPKFFRVTTVILLFVAFQLVISGLHELSENGVLPSSRSEMALIGPIVRNDLFFFVTILALAGVMALFEYRRRQPQVVESASRAEQRKAKWTARRERLWTSAVYASSFVFILLVTAQFIYAKTTTSLSPATEVALAAHELRIPTAQVSDGDLHRYVVNVARTDVRFWIMKKPDGSFASVFDACEICGAIGFYKGVHGIICKNCAAPVNPQAVGQAGGCNPVPLRSTTDGAMLVISEADLAAGARLFRQ